MPSVSRVSRSGGSVVPSLKPRGFNLHYLNAEHLPKCELVTWLVPFAEGVFTSFAHLKTLVLFSSSCD